MGIKERRFMMYLVGGFSGAFALSLGVLSVLPTFGVDSLSIYRSDGKFILLIVFLTSVIIGVVAAMWRTGIEVFVPKEESFTLRPEEKPSKTETSEELVSYLTVEFNKGNYQQVVRWGKNFSRPLWVDGLYESRIEVGNLVVQASKAIDNVESEIWALIDDLGWTYVAIGRLEKAKENINKGIKLALKQANIDHYLLAKAYRHLSGIAFRESNFKGSEDFSKEAEVEASKIGDEKKRLEMQAGINFGRAEMTFEMKQSGKDADIDKAIEFCKGAQTAYQQLNDKERQVKTYSLLSKLYLLKNDFEQAGNLASLGLEIATRTTRKDELIKNLIIIAKIMISEGEVKMAIKNLETAIKEATGINLEEEARTAKKLLEEANKDVRS